MVVGASDDPQQRGMEDAIAEIQAKISDIQGKLNIYENQQSEWKVGLTTAIKVEVEKLTEGLRHVHDKTAAAVDVLTNRIAASRSST